MKTSISEKNVGEKLKTIRYPGSRKDAHSVPLGPVEGAAVTVNSTLEILNQPDRNYDISGDQISL